MMTLSSLVDPSAALAAHAMSRIAGRMVLGCLTPDADERDDAPAPASQRRYISYEARKAAMREYMRARRAERRQRNG